MRRPVSLVLALGSAVLTSCGGGHNAGAAYHPTRASTTDALTASGPALVPWADLPATHPTIPSTRVPARPDPAIARTARPCRARDLVLHDLGIGAAAGTEVENLRFTLAGGHTPCAVSGRPGLDVRTVEGTLVHGGPTGWASYRRPVLVSDHASALVQVVWPSACFVRSGRASATLRYVGGSWREPLGTLSRTCHFEPDRPLDSVGVTDFLPPHRRPARRVTAYDDVAVHGPSVVPARLGRATTFHVTLVARHDLTLDPCPDFRIGATTGDGGRHAVNCAGVPWRDARGRAYLPAHRPVEFEMRFEPVESTAKFFWSIVARGSPPYVAGQVLVR